ncbi:hypothetical protein K3720_04360 [Leisingera caerulea]|uniref:hypothetical protein n=1 Tax=Leisingera caerulea TaxID=506591 RepID=UPI0021A33B54|nr:hypothetical protein [Leisingera caerulea]UWQ50646.1 hypothetical protein K3720_04360 [Leisingera caerulea]
MPRDFLSAPPHTAFIVANAAALCSAAALLGGPAAEARVQRLVDDLCLMPSMAPRICRELDALEDLLGLEHVHDFDRVEAERFAAIAPMDPVVDEICLLFEGLREARS